MTKRKVRVFEQSIRDKFKVYCIEKKIDMSELLEKLIEKELKK